MSRGVRRFVELVTMDILFLSDVIPGSIYLFGKSFFCY